MSVGFTRENLRLECGSVLWGDLFLSGRWLFFSCRRLFRLIYQFEEFGIGIVERARAGIRHEEDGFIPASTAEAVGALVDAERRITPICWITPGAVVASDFAGEDRVCPAALGFLYLPH